VNYAKPLLYYAMPALPFHYAVSRGVYTCAVYAWWLLVSLSMRAMQILTPGWCIAS